MIITNQTILIIFAAIILVFQFIILIKLKKMDHSLAELTQKVSEETTLEQSLVTLTSGIKAKLDAITVGVLPDAVQKQINDLFDQVSANNSALSNAISANTVVDSTNNTDTGNTGSGNTDTELSDLQP